MMNMDLLLKLQNSKFILNSLSQIVRVDHINNITQDFAAPSNIKRDVKYGRHHIDTYKCVSFLIYNVNNKYSLLLDLLDMNTKFIYEWNWKNAK